jgi:hypothetical protein
MMIDAGLFGPVYEPVPLPTQPLKVKPGLACALMVTFDPAFFQPLAGCTVPPLPALIVRKYWVWNVPV